MGFLSWFKKDNKKSEAEIDVKGNALDSEAFAEAVKHEHAHSLHTHPAVAQKIMMLSTENHFSNILIRYALDMARRMDCEIVAVNVLDVPRSLPAREKKRAIEVFEETTKKNTESLVRMADSEGIKVMHLVEVGDPEKVADKLHASYPGIRCVVTEPEESTVEYSEELIPVYCFT